MNRFFILPENITEESVLLSEQQSHQIRNVLRLKSTDHIIVLDNCGFEYEAELTDVNAKQVCACILDKRAIDSQTNLKLTVFQSMLARDKFEWVLQKCTELGVHCIVPVITRRSLVQKSGTVKSGKLQRWQRILTEAAEQSERAHIPVLDEALGFDKALKRAMSLDLPMIAVCRADADALRTVLQGNLGKGVSSAGVFIGPEGGFDPCEIEMAVRAGLKPVHLGQRILRTETAAVVFSALIMYESEGFYR